MKCRIFIITYISSICIYLIRTSYPFVQLQIAHYYDTDSKFIGLMSGVIYIILGISNFAHIFFPFKRLVLQYFVEINLSSIFFLLVPIMMFFNIKSQVLTLICFGLFGWFQSTSYSILTDIVRRYFNPIDDGFLVGFWGSCSSAGYILSFFISTLIVYYFQASWILCLVYAPVITIIVTSLMRGLLNEEEVEENREFSCA